MPRAAIAYGVVTVVAAAGLWRVESTANEAEDAARAVEHEAEDRAAQSCISGFEIREQIRDAIETATRAGSEALIAVVGTDADPATVELFRQTVAAQVAAAREEVTDPDCDLQAARAELEGE